MTQRMKEQLKWVKEPPPSRRGRRNRSELVEKLKERPGDWALIATDAASSYASGIRAGKYGFGPLGAFEAVHRNTSKNGRGDVYARYVGEVGVRKGVSHYPTALEAQAG